MASHPTSEENLNAHNVIRLDVTDVLRRAGDGEDAAHPAGRLVVEEMRPVFPELEVPDSLTAAILSVVRNTGRAFIFLVDAWDAPIREYAMLGPKRYAPYAGFTESEVRGLCERNGMDFAEARRWHDG